VDALVFIDQRLRRISVLKKCSFLIFQPAPFTIIADRMQDHAERWYPHPPE
jgi:hypothetical protein